MKIRMLLLVCLVWSATSHADPLSDAAAAYDRQDYTEAVRLYALARDQARRFTTREDVDNYRRMAEDGLRESQYEAQKRGLYRVERVPVPVPVPVPVYPPGYADRDYHSPYRDCREYTGKPCKKSSRDLP